MTTPVDDTLLRSLTPSVIGILVRRGADFAAAEDAVQDALVEALRVWPDDPPRNPKAWLVTVAWRKFLDVTRADASRRAVRSWPTLSCLLGCRLGCLLGRRRRGLRWTTRSSSTSCAPTPR